MPSNGLISGKQYKARVYANNFVTNTFAAHQSVWSAYLFFFTSEIVKDVPLLSATVNSRTDAWISWSLLGTAASKGFTTTDPVYYLEMDNGRGGEFWPLFSSTTQNFYDVNGITPGTTLRFRLMVENNMGFSEYGKILDVLYAEIPSAP